MPNKTGRSTQIVLMSLACALMTNANAEGGMPEGMKGWTYFSGTSIGRYFRTPHEACGRSASNHMGTPLLFMQAAPVPNPAHRCFYRHFWRMGGVHDYTTTELHCEFGYTAKWPGVCVKWPEKSRPPGCTPNDPGFALGNPVALGSGAKVQSETDFTGSANGTLRLARTFRTLRDSGAGQSAGQGWSFSFDRHFSANLQRRDGLALPPDLVTGVFGDGTYFEFVKTAGGAYISKYDKREALVSLSPAFDDWTLTTRDGSIERFKKSNGRFLLVSSHSKEGVGQFYSYDAADKLATISTASGRSLKVAWSGNVVASVTGVTGSVRYGYEMEKSDEDLELPGTERLATVEFYDESERHLTTKRYHYDDANNRHLLTGVTDENGVRFATYAYSASGKTVLSEHAGGANRYTFSYPEQAKRIVTDPLGTERVFALALRGDSTGRVASTSQPGGAGCGPGTSRLTYDALGRITSSTDFNDKKTCFVNDPIRGLVSSTVSGLAAGAACPASGAVAIAASSRRTSTQWHPDIKMETAIAGPRLITRYVYNGQRDASGKVASCADNGTLPNGKPIIVLCARTVQATRDANGAAGFSAQPDGNERTWDYNYNASGQLLRQTGPADAAGQSETISHVYYDDTTASHGAGDLASTRDAAGGVTHYLEYTKDGLPRKIERPDGVIVNLEYDARQRITSSIAESGGQVQATIYTYDGVGQLTGILKPDGATVTLGYDDAHRLTSVLDGVGNRVTLTLDNMGNVTRQDHRNAAGDLVLVTNKAFDALNRLASVYRESLALATTLQYDRSGNLTSVKDVLGRITKNEFDNLDRMTSNVLPAAVPGNQTTAIGYAYDHQDNLVSVTDPRKLTTRYTLDGFGQQRALSSPDTGAAVSSFDDAGNLMSRRDSRGVTTGYLYDAAKRITKSGDTSFEYGQSGTSSAGKLTKMTDASGASGFGYDGFGRLQTQLQTVGSGHTAKQFKLGYVYGSSGSGTGHVTSMTYPSGNRIDITYGADGKASSLAVTGPMASVQTMIMSNIGYTALGAVQRWTWGDPANQDHYERQFDGNGRLTNYPLGPMRGNGNLRTLNYDAADRITSMVHSGGPNASGLDQRYTYDGLDRLTQVEGANVSQAFGYDANGNRTRARFGAGMYTNTIAATSNRVTSTSGPVPAKINAYDNVGNLTSDGSAKYTYGSNGRLAEVVANGITTRYRYNGFGERVEKSSAAGAFTYYVYDLAGRLLGEYDRYGNAEQETVYLGDLPVAVLKAAVKSGTNQPPALAVYNVYADHILTPRVIARLSDNRIVWRWDNADPFGLQQPDESPEGLAKFTYNPRFPGQVFDKETGLHYNYFRDYDPQIGRYVQSDPIGLEGGANTYGYVDGNPLASVDPRGLSTVTYDGNTRTITVRNSSGTTIGTYPANNKTTTTSNGPWPNGTFPYSHSNPHPTSGANGPYGSHGIFVFTVPGRSGMGLHSGRAASGAQDHPTLGCVRTTNTAMQNLRDIVTNDPITSITIVNNNPTAPQSGTQQ